MPRHRALEALALALCLGACECEPEARTGIPDVRAIRASGRITADGQLDEPAWQTAPRTEEFVDTMTGTSSGPRATARLLWDAAALYVAFEIEDDFLVCAGEGTDAHLWEKDAAEVMIDPNGDGRGYFELQVCPTGMVFDTRFDSRRAPPPFGHLEWASELQPGVDARGTANDDESDEGYTVEAAIPWRTLAAGIDPATPPETGDEWRIALYVLDARPDGGQRGVGWSPPLIGDFHVPDRFGRVVFAGGGSE